MNRIYSALTFFAIIVAMIGCKKESLSELNKGNVPLVLTASTNTISLQEKDRDSEILIFTWTTGSNQGTDAAINYTLQLAKEGTNFASPVSESLGKATYTRKFTVGALNDTLRNHFNATTEQNIEARIIAETQSDGVTAETSPVIHLKITPYQPVTSVLFLIGDATPNGWDANKASAMTSITTEPGGFTWSGSLRAGNLKFITTLGQFLPSYNKGSSSTSLLYRTDNAQPDDQFLVPTGGLYDVKVNLLTLSISITQSSLPPFAKLWMVGDATPNGWNIDNPNELQVDSSNLFVFNYNGLLNAGEFKIPTGKGNWGGDFYMPLTNHPALTATDVQLVAGGSPDNKWQISTAGPYKIKLDLQTMKIDITPFTPYTKLWMVGDATPVGWNIDSPTPMIATAGNPYEFTYTGPLTVGEFKIPAGTGNWGGDFFMPMVNHQNLSSRLAKFVPGGSPDNKWQISVAGNYKIVFNQLNETIDITKY